MINPNDEKAITHYTALLMYHDTGAPTFAADARRFAEIYQALVPEDGHASSIQGEILRAVGVLSTEDRRNGCVNWDDDYEQLVEFLRKSLAMDELINAIQRDQILVDLDAVLENGRKGIDYQVIRFIFGRLIEASVAFCRAYAELAPNEVR